ncbi:tubulin polyglutamylase TTLL5 isoform X2 [Amblyraja radiata]|uniref:tubulin polyglutamylase TTLL5 isoform X2 n=1 Tax=Amblyraja radiata TaxID=386614 RepID=UPI00140381B4|nr:tubulin polyglutamylase TTLL5 isoform X2 [Amblyraja radiata]
MPAVSHVPEDSSASSDGEEQEEHPCLRWAGSNRMIPTLVFYAESIVTKDSSLRLIGERYHLAYKIVRTESRLVRTILTVHGFHEVHPNSNDFNLMWTGSHLKPYLLRTLLEFQKVNHFPRSYELTRKDRLYKNIQRMQQTHGFKHFNIIPQAFLLPAEYQELWNAHTKDKGPWIVKPVASSRGRGVYLVSHPSQITVDESILVSRYIHSPLLIDDFKFDVRLYVLVTSYDPLMVYLYEEGLTRFATVKYNRGSRNIKNQFMHLTNYSINKKSRDYVSCDDPEVEDYGNKWSMSAMLRYLKQEGVDTAALMSRIEDLIIKALISAEIHIAAATKMFVPHKGNCFELYGFDVLIDSNLKPWLLEVNLSPSLACDAPLDLKIKASLLTDMFTLVGFVCHNPIVRQGRQSKTGGDLAARPQTHKPRQQWPVSTNNGEVKRSSSSGKERARDGQGLSTLRLTMEEIKVLRHAMEENERKGGFIRIFPMADSWEFYGHFLEHKTTLNHVLAVRLFAGKQGAKRPAALARARNGVRQSSPAAQCRHEVLQVQCQKHLQQYERKLLSLKARKHRQQQQVTLQTAQRKGSGSLHTVPAASSCGSESELEEEEEEGEEEDVDEEEASECEAEVSLLDCSGKGPGKALPLVAQRGVDERQRRAPTQEVAGKHTAIRGEAWTQSREECSQQQPRPNLVQMLQQGANLSKVQARMAFAAYLHRVQLRLLQECCGQNKASSQADREEEQMELVIRFLKRAASNFQHTMPLALPSSRLAGPERRRILAQQLGLFIRCYNKETDEIIKRKQMDLNSETCIQQEEFQVFVSKASETQLEELLTIYTRNNKSTSVFLGTQATSRSESSSTEDAAGRAARGVAATKEGGAAGASDGCGDGSLLAHSSSAHGVGRARPVSESVGSLPRSHTLDHGTPPPPETETAGRAGPAAHRMASATPTSRQPTPPGKVHGPSSDSLASIPASSMQAAAHIYSQRLSRPNSATPGTGGRCTQRQRSSDGIHTPAPLDDLNLVLQRLAAKHNPRHWPQSTHISLLTQHLSHMGLGRGALNRGNAFVSPATQWPVGGLVPARTVHSGLQPPAAASVDRAAAASVDRAAAPASCGPMDIQCMEHKADAACRTATVPMHQAVVGEQQFLHTLHHLQQQHLHSRQLLHSSRARHQAICAENQLDIPMQWPALASTRHKPLVSGQWAAGQQRPEPSQGSPPHLPRPPATSKQGVGRKVSAQRVSRVIAIDGRQPEPTRTSLHTPVGSGSAQCSAIPARNGSEWTSDYPDQTH